MTQFNGPDAVSVYQVLVIASALRLYAKTGMKANRAYTPTAMLAAAKRITGRAFKRGQYVQAADALKAWADAKASTLPQGAIT